MPRASASVLVVDDEELIRWSLEKELVTQGYAVGSAATAGDALRAFASEPADVVLLDIRLPDGDGLRLIPELHTVREDTAIVMITSVTSLETAVDAMRLGAWDYVTKPFDFPKLWHTIAKAVERIQLRQENRTLRTRDRPWSPEIIAESPAMQKALELAGTVAASDTSTVLICGESGVGKDLIARYIHDRSSRASRLFLDLNCAAVPETLLESELFGHERGAFTDAKTQKRGLFELAAGGTAYLDEIADAPLAAQAKLLKVLEQRTFRRLGGVRDLTADVRVIAATNRDLEEALAQKSLRQDLYYRLKVFPIDIPPLRQRREDIVPLARSFLSSYGRGFRKRVPGFEPDAERLLGLHPWPGNVRELRNIIERAVILAPAGAAIGVELLPHELGEGHASDGSPSRLAQEEARLIREALEQTGGNQTRAAHHLGISRDALRRRMHKLGLPSGHQGQGA